MGVFILSGVMVLIATIGLIVKTVKNRLKKGGSQ